MSMGYGCHRRQQDGNRLQNYTIDKRRMDLFYTVESTSNCLSSLFCLQFVCVWPILLSDVLSPCRFCLYRSNFYGFMWMLCLCLAANCTITHINVECGRWCRWQTIFAHSSMVWRVWYILSLQFLFPQWNGKKNRPIPESNKWIRELCLLFYFYSHAISFIKYK